MCRKIVECVVSYLFFITAEAKHTREIKKGGNQIYLKNIYIHILSTPSLFVCVCVYEKKGKKDMTNDDTQHPRQNWPLKFKKIYQRNVLILFAVKHLSRKKKSK